jgi:hypothetical protein
LANQKCVWGKTLCRQIEKNNAIRNAQSVLATARKFRRRSRERLRRAVMTQARYWSIALIYLVAYAIAPLRSQPDQRLADGAPAT